MAFSFSEFWRKEGSATANKTGGQKWEGGRRNSWSEAASSSAHPDPHRGSAQGESRRQKRSKNLWNFPAEPQINISTRSRAGGQLLGWRWACCRAKDTDSRNQRFVLKGGPVGSSKKANVYQIGGTLFCLFNHSSQQPLKWRVKEQEEGMSRPRTHRKCPEEAQLPRLKDSLTTHLRTFQNCTKLIWIQNLREKQLPMHSWRFPCRFTEIFKWMIQALGEGRNDIEGSRCRRIKKLWFLKNYLHFPLSVSSHSKL